MATVADTARPIAWWKEPTKEQWYAWVAAWAGWTLDAFDFTAFLLIMVPIAKEFDVPVSEVAFVLTITLWMRLVGATANGWLAGLCLFKIWCVAPVLRRNTDPGSPWKAR